MNSSKPDHIKISSIDLLHFPDAIPIPGTARIVTIKSFGALLGVGTNFLHDGQPWRIASASHPDGKFIIVRIR